MAKERPTLNSFYAATPNFEAGRDTPRAFLERCLDAIAEFEPEVGAFIHLEIENAKAVADRSSERWRQGRKLSQIDGMPVGIKDIIETSDMPTQMGSPLYAEWRSGRDGASVVALREAGAIILGKNDHDRVRHAASIPHDPQPLGPKPHAGRIEQRLCSRRRLRHGAGGPRHTGAVFHCAPGQLLRLHRL